MGLTIETGVSALAVFLQGILSFFSPCVLPLVPLYVGYLAGGRQTDDKGNAVYPRGKVMCNTVFFVVGVSFAFFLLGMGFTTLGSFLSRYRNVISRLGGVLIILFGLYQMGALRVDALAQERRLPFRIDKLAMSPIVALLFGFVFSFAWTPCVGPALAGVLLMASSAGSQGAGFLLIGVYTLGFVLPFLAAGLFTSTLLDWFRRYRHVVKYTVKAGGALLIIMGLLMVTGAVNSINQYLAGLSGNTPSASVTQRPESSQAGAPQTDEQTDKSSGSGSTSAGAPGQLRPSIDFTLADQYGNSHTLSDYKGKTVFLNFWATWCGYCKEEMPDIQALYEDNGLNEEEVIILGVAAPDAGDVSEEELTAFLEEGGYTYPVLYDTTGEVFSDYGASGLPTTFFINADGNVLGYVPGMMTRDIMDGFIEQTKESASAP